MSRPIDRIKVIYGHLWAKQAGFYLKLINSCRRRKCNYIVIQHRCCKFCKCYTYLLDWDWDDSHEFRIHIENCWSHVSKTNSVFIDQKKGHKSMDTKTNGGLIESFQHSLARWIFSFSPYYYYNASWHLAWFNCFFFSLSLRIIDVLLLHTHHHQTTTNSLTIP